MPVATSRRNGKATAEPKRSTIEPTPGFPFECVLSLAPLIRYVTDRMCRDRIGMVEFGDKIRTKVEEHPMLLEPIADLSFFEEHSELVDRLMSVVFPPAYWDRDCKAAIVPYSFMAFYRTPLFTELMVDGEGRFAAISSFGNSSAFASGRILTAYIRILQEFHGVTLDFDFPVVTTIRDPETGLERHHKLDIDVRFLEVEAVGPVTPISEDDMDRLLADPTNFDLLRELVPPENFRFVGFAIVNAVDVTDQEAISALKRELIKNDVIVSETGFQVLQSNLRSLLKRPDLTLHLAAMEGSQVLQLDSGLSAYQGCIVTSAIESDMKDYAGSIFERAMLTVRPQIIENLETYAARTSVEESILAKGYRNLYVAPLLDGERVIGALTLWSTRAGDLNVLNTLKLKEVIPLFAIAVKRSMDDLSNRVQAVIREEYTAIHPSVDWRFRRAALNFIRRQSLGEQPDPEPIVFHDVYPLFGESDIRGSSEQRNLAIQADLIEQLVLVREIILLAREHRELPVLDNLAYKITRSIRNLENGLHSGDEATVLEMLQRMVDPLFDHIAGFGEEVALKVRDYRARLDPELGVIYEKRRDFEESVTTINRTIATYIDAEEERAQKMFPHYFEQHQTDGVDFGIYVGASLLESGEFNLLYLKNLRLWQLIVLCGAARSVEAIMPTLQVPLEAAHLVLVQSMPLSIRFRMDEKQFDVDGAYNIRYEIMKKRIDKALVRGTRERLTQPGKIAIVYSQPREATEYREYIEYLQSIGYLAGTVEDLEIEDLQGVQGLKALRVTVAPAASGDDAMPIVPEEIERAVRTMSNPAPRS